MFINNITEVQLYVLLNFFKLIIYYITINGLNPLSNTTQQQSLFAADFKQLSFRHSSFSENEY